MDKAINGITKTTASGHILRLAIFGIFTIVAAALAYAPLRDLITNASRSDYYSHILLIPCVTTYFLFEQRKDFLEKAEYKPGHGTVLGIAGLLMYAVALWLRERLGVNDFASVATAGSITLWWGGFLFVFGGRSFRVALFALLFMLFTIPIPEFLLDRLIYVLQVGSTEITQWLFELTGTNYIRDGFVYQLTGINIEVAKECSSIRSSIALIITGVVAGHLFLRSGWNKVWLLIAMIPINIIKNGIRITTLSLLAVYVDRKFITDSFLHHSGGFLFYLPALGMMTLMVMWLRKKERAQGSGFKDQGEDLDREAKKDMKDKGEEEQKEQNLPQMGTDERR